MTSSVVTLFEGHYHMGLGALVNSLYMHGFRGYVYAGYRGALPPWARPIQAGSDFSEFQVAEGCWIRFVKVETPWHLTNYKPKFMLDVWDRLSPEADAMFYFDPDIAIRCRWSFYESWIRYGIGLCQEITASAMPSNHPIRCEWKRWMLDRNIATNYELAQYFNGGFVGLLQQHKAFLETWHAIMVGISQEVDLSGFTPGDRSQPFNMTDQDGLNMAAMATRFPLSTIGPEGMDLVPGGFTMSHAVGSPKPWRKQFTACALRGRSLSNADRLWLANSSSPIQVLTSGQKRLRAIDLKIGSAIGRFVRRA